MLTVIETLDQIGQGTSPILYFSRYRADRVDNGGARRVAQLRQLLDRYEVEFVSSQARLELPTIDKDSNIRNNFFDRAQQEVVRMLTHKYSAEFGRWIFYSDLLARRWVRALKVRQKPRLVLVDDPIFFPSLIRYCSRVGIPVIALCQNIETLSRRQVVPRYQQELLLYEMSLLCQCRAVVTISAEEAFLLRNMGQAVLHIPYYPPDAIEQKLLEVRQHRSTSSKQNFLLMGSAGNPPTRAGMERLLIDWRELGGVPGEKLLVAGYGTEVLRELAGVADIEFLGEVTDDLLDCLQGRVWAGIVCQEEGAGALTRIGEYLLAGVPVMANHHAARSWHNLAGLYEFTESADLLQKLHNFLSNNLDVPQPPLADAAPLHQMIVSVLSGS